MSDEWAESLAEKINKTLADRKQNEQLDLQRQSAMQSQIPHLWKELYAALQENLKLVNKRVPGTTPYFLFRPDPKQTGVAQIDTPYSKFEVSLLEPLKRILIYRIIEGGPFSEAKKNLEKSLGFTVTNGDVWIQSDEGENLSVPATAQYILETVSI